MRDDDGDGSFHTGYFMVGVGDSNTQIERNLQSAGSVKSVEGLLIDRKDLRYSYRDPIIRSKENLTSSTRALRCY